MSDLFPAGDTTSAIESAVASMSDADAGALDFGGLVEQPRDEAGKFAKPEAEAKAEPDAKAEDEKQPEAEASEADDDEDYIEIPPEAEGAEPSKLKLAEVLDGYKQAQTLRQELEQARKVTPIPAELENQLAQQVAARQQLMSLIDALNDATKPVVPDLELVNPNNPNKFNPAAYHQQVAQYQQQMAERQQLQEARALAEKQQAEQQAVIAEARYRREFAKAVELWPELKDKAVARKVVDDMAKTYGFSPEEVQAIGDARVLSVLKDALAYRSGKAAQETAVKVVKAKPKLVRATARQSTGGRSASAAQHLERLGKTGSMDDAVAALAELL